MISGASVDTLPHCRLRALDAAVGRGSWGVASVGGVVSECRLGGRPGDPLMCGFVRVFGEGT